MKTIYKIRNNYTGKHEGAYSRAYHTEYEFDTPEQARSSNVHGIFEDEEKYTIEEYEVEYKLVREL